MRVRRYYFNQHIFAWELQQYKSEGLPTGGISYRDNKPLLDMVLDRPIGMFALLDEECRFPRSTSQSLA